MANKIVDEKTIMEEAYRREQRWADEGNYYRLWRERLGLTKAYIKQETDLDYGRLTRFENGDRVKEARLIARVYKLTLEKVETLRELERLHDSIRIMLLKKN